MSQSASKPIAAAPDYARAREQMVDTQIRPVNVNDPRIIKAMREIARERFVPGAASALAYADNAVRLGEGRMLLEPRIIARLLQAAVPRAGERALVVAAATGYSACLLHRLGLQVIALETDPELSRRGAALCAELAPGVRFEGGALAQGWAGAAPYDLIVIDGAVPSLPPMLARQLSKAGRLAAVLRPPGQVGTAIIAEASNGGLRARTKFDAQAALIPELSSPPAFVF